MDELMHLKAELAALFHSEGKVLLGALLGALFVTVTRGQMIFAGRRRLSFGSKCMLVFLVLGVGYLFGPLIKGLVPMLSRDMSAFVAAVVVIPLSLKAMVWLDAVNLSELAKRWRR
ncbi:hypothetical protein [Pseudomonas sp. NPDC089401]|uniref:hypothetical protein n=1 Tax=Pseudomonas sp. NPDC089401 TaxID=3364462 RepID=UPI003827E7B0